MNKQTKSLSLYFIVGVVINLMVIIGYIYFWSQSKHNEVLPEEFIWGDTSVNHQPWGWGEWCQFAKLFHCFLFFPMIALLLGLPEMKNKTKYFVSQSALSIILVIVAWNHLWLLD